MPSASKIELPERYRVVRHIASGGMASVWEAQDLLLRRTVAVKVLGAQLDLDPSARERFQREARTAAQISDRPNIVTIYDIGEHNEQAFIVMEYCAGGTVADRLRAARSTGARVPRGTALHWLREAATGLDVAHGAGIVHRDVKPANLMLDDHDRLSVGDFGIARLADDTQMTQTGQVLGTVAYLSPEQALGQPATVASDRYALAVVAYELLTGERPFGGGPAAAQARQHVEAPPPQASAAAPRLPATIDPVLARGLAKDPSERPSSAAAFVSGLESALSAGDTRATESARPTAPTRRERTRGHVREAEPVATPPAREPRARSRRLTPLVLLALAALAIGGIAALAAGGTNDSPSADGSDRTASQARERTTTSAKRKSAPTPASGQPAATATTPAFSGGSPSALDARGYDLIERKRYAEAVPIEEQAVAGFRDGGDRRSAGYAFALYNLGTALNRSGRPSEAIPFLEERLSFSNDRRSLIEQELAAARAAAGASAKPKKK